MNNEADRGSNKARHYEFWILLFCTLLLFFHPIFLNQTFYFRDLHLHFFPQKLRFVEFLRTAQLPLWDPYLHGGQPYLADLNNMALYPSNFLYALLPPVFALNLDIILHIFLCAAGAYFLARSLGLSPLAATIAGGIYAFCGYTLSLANLLNRLAAMPYLPFLLLAFQRFLISKRPRWFVIATILGTLQIFAGAPEMTALSWLTLLIWLIAHRETKSLIYFALLIVFIAGIAAIQILPAMEMVRQSSRAAGTDYANFSAWSLNPRRLPELILPAFLGSVNAITTKGYWGFRLESMGFPFILSIYFGAVTILCAVFGISRAIWTKILAVLIAISFLMSLGSYLPFFHGLYEHFHFLTGARYPIKILAIALLPLSLLSAAGIDHIFSPEFSQKRRVAICLWVTAVLLSICYGLAAVSADAFTKTLNFFFYSATDIARHGVKNSLLHAALITLLAALIYQLSIQKETRWTRPLFAILILSDLISAGFSVNSYASPDFFNTEPSLARSVLNQLDGGRLYRATNTPGLRVNLPADDKMYLYRWNLETLQGYSGAMYSIPVVYHEDFDDLAKQEVNRVSDWMLRAPWQKRIPLLKAAGVTLFISPDVVESRETQLLSRVTNNSSMTLYVYRILNSKGLVFIPNQTESLTSQEEIFARMIEDGFDPYQRTFVSNGSLNAKSCANGLQELERKSNSWKLKAHSDCDSVIYFAQPFYRGWVTRIDGTEVPSYEANYAFSASPLPKGDHTVERIYQPASFKWGCVISLISFAALMLISRRLTLQ